MGSWQGLMEQYEQAATGEVPRVVRRSEHSISPNHIQPGVYLDLDEAAYHAIPALSNSGMKDLVISDLAYYDAHLAPDRPEREQKDCFDFGKAAHSRILEPALFFERYVRRLEKSAVEDALDTNEQLKAWLKEHDLKVSGNKVELVQRILESGKPHPRIWEIEESAYGKKHAGKVFLDKADADAIEIMAALVAADPYTKHLFVGGMPEVSFIVRDPETGVLLKARMDYVKDCATRDFKTFTNARRKPIAKAVADAMFYEGYFKQAVIYQTIRELAREQVLGGEIEIHGACSEEWRDGFLNTENHTFGVLFVESQRPFHMEFRELREREADGADMNKYWLHAETYMRTMINRYADCFDKYGDRPWREPAEPITMTDSNFPQLAYEA